MRGLVILLFFTTISCTTIEDDPFNKVKSESTLIKDYFERKDQHELQIVYTQINRDTDNHPSLTSYTFNYDSTAYFYPASTVKMPVAFLALQKLNELGIDKWTAMKTDSARAPQSIAYVDTTSRSGLPNVAHYIEKVFAVSDNDAYNRLYEFVGQDYINKNLRSKNIFSNSRIVTRVGIGGFSTEDNTYTNPVSFFDEDDNLIYSQGATKSSGDYFSPLTSTLKGVGYFDDGLDKVVDEPFNMSKKNFINLKDLEASLMRVILPEIFSEEERFDITETDYEFLLQSLQKTPREHPYLSSEVDEYYDSYVKFFLYGDSKDEIPSNIRIFNKVGFAYGYLTDCSYIVDFETGVEFFLTATIHMNENKIYNDGKYEYDEGIAFLAELGRKIYQIEKDRSRTVKADLSKYRPKG